MRELNWFEKLINKYWDIRSAMCFHVFEEDFSEQIENNWEQCSSSLTCKKCGMSYPYYFKFKKSQEN
jgi:hypothetical protein